MRRRTSLAAATALAAAWALAGCGIPTGKAPEVVGDAPTDFDSSSGANPTVYLPTTSATDTVANFLKAASGDPDGRDDRLNEFTVSGEEPFSEPDAGISLVASLSMSLNESEDLNVVTVTVTGSVVGSYADDGSVRMHSNPGEYDETFTMQRQDFQEPWKMSTLPVQVALDYDHFTQDYEQAPIYFQAAGQEDLLVPELHWIYNELDIETRQRLLFTWILQRPAPDFAGVAASNAIPLNSSGRYDGEDGFEVDLSPSEAIEDEAADAIAAQIVWSFGIEGAFTLKIDGDIRFEGDAAEFRDWNAIPPNLPETAYFIANNTVWQYSAEEGVTQRSAEHPWVGYKAAGLEQVAVGRTGTVAAVVAGSSGDVLQTGASTTAMREVAGLGGTLTDPQWLSQDAVLVIDDGVPTLVDPSTDTAQALGVGEEVTAMTLAADGRRLAYVEDGNAWVAPLKVDADRNVTVGSPRRIGLDIESVSDVAWSSENFLWVAGERGDDQLFRVAIDNSRTVPQEGTVGFPPITQIAASPAEPSRVNAERGEPVIIVANSTLYRVFTNSLDDVRNGDEPVGGTAPFTVLQQ
ncbi:hypothetical protein O1R50_03065 [Glycomyces luteolus]|uniref:Sporulation and spore germination protein n=1 Tax=Glycomyces luteolus TaxID=2670330 RepID=A0A9X3T2B0_9ACTN|nr:LpqB family beta-propeller domain-containing protein [Glycomyces luteolus]MDA1358585.1 hypothetical protein [Glycomyces luteolus]